MSKDRENINEMFKSLKFKVDFEPENEENIQIYQKPIYSQVNVQQFYPSTSRIKFQNSNPPSPRPAIYHRSSTLIPEVSPCHSNSQRSCKSRSSTCSLTLPRSSLSAEAISNLELQALIKTIQGIKTRESQLHSQVLNIAEILKVCIDSSQNSVTNNSKSSEVKKLHSIQSKISSLSLLATGPRNGQLKEILEKLHKITRAKIDEKWRQQQQEAKHGLDTSRSRSRKRLKVKSRDEGRSQSGSDFSDNNERSRCYQEKRDEQQVYTQSYDRFAARKNYFCQPTHCSLNLNHANKQLNENRKVEVRTNREVTNGRSNTSVKQTERNLYNERFYSKKLDNSRQVNKTPKRVNYEKEVRYR